MLRISTCSERSDIKGQLPVLLVEPTLAQREELTFVCTRLDYGLEGFIQVGVGEIIHSITQDHTVWS